jgi:hypothetical protein
MSRLSSHAFGPAWRTLGVLAATATLGLGFAAAAQAGVTFPRPGALTLSGGPAQIRAGHTLTMHENLPLAVFNGEFALQSESSPGVWQTLVSAPPRPRVVWLHWKVPAMLKGAHLTVRYLLNSGGKMLAVSPNYVMSVTS